MIYPSDVQKAAQSFAVDMKENSMEDGFGGSSPRKVCSEFCTYAPCALLSHHLSGLPRGAIALKRAG